MGQKVNPIGFRVGVNHAWGSRWFAPKKTFGAYLIEDQKIREVCKKRLAEAGISKILIERYLNRVRVTLFSARPGVIIGRKGGDVEAIRAELEKMTKKEVYLEIKEVQGADAAPAIAQMIAVANAYNMADVLIVGRGGGSLEDLLPFSEEVVVRAVAESQIPVVSAVGHEIDWALSDFVADMRAPTPSAAAELVTPLLTEVTGQMEYWRRDFYESISSRLDRMRLLVKSFTPDSLELRFRTIQQPLLARFDTAKELILSAMEDKCKDARHRIENSLRDLEGANPSAILARGYSMVQDKATGKVIRSPADTKPGQILEIRPATGIIQTQVLTTEEHT